MQRDSISGALSENLITLLAHDAEHGRAVCHLVEAAYYEGEYRAIAEKCIDFWRKYDRPPGVHTADLFSTILEDPNNRKANTYKRILQSMQALWDAGINAKYVLQEAYNFKRGTEIKAAILQSAEKINAHQEQAIGDIEELWHNILRVRDVHFDPGMTLDQYDKVLDNLARRQMEFTTGIKELDAAGVVPYRSALMMMVARAKGGKSWWLTNLGKQAFGQRKKIAHVSLEMSEELNLQRYYQALWSITVREAELELTQLRTRVGDHGEQVLAGIQKEWVKPPLTFRSSIISEELESRLEQWAKRAQNIKVKRFPPRALTPNALRGYLDNLEVACNFIPDMLILDYASLMKTDIRNHRLELGRNIEELRAIAVERNIAVVSAHQSNREGAKGRMVHSTNVGEDWSVVQTADTILTFSSTKAEKGRGLGRLYVANSRDERDEWGLVIAQGIPMGQFCLQSAPLADDYWDIIKIKEPEESDDELMEDDE